MLIENKFIYVSLPRCASTSFMASCVKQNLNISHLHSHFNIENQIKSWNIDINKVDYNNFEEFFDHGHEPLIGLKRKFGYSYDVISVKRNKYERFASLWRYILKMLYLIKDIDTFNKCFSLSLDEILFYKTHDLQSAESIDEQIEIFSKKHNLYRPNFEKQKELFKTLISPCSRFHNYDSDIIWFDFNELYKLEEWVSNKLDMDFKLLNMNSSKDFPSNLILTDEFKEKYDSIYLPYDEIKSVKTLL